MNAFIKKHMLSALLWISISIITQAIPDVLSGQWNDPDCWQQILYGGIISGLVVAGLLAGLHYYKLRKMGIKHINNQDVSSRQSKKFLVDYSEQYVLKKIEQEIGFQAQTVSNGKSKYAILDWSSWNKTIVSFRQQTSYLEVLVDSKPILSTILLDYGKSLQRIKSIEKALFP